MSIFEMLIYFSQPKEIRTEYFFTFEHAYNFKTKLITMKKRIYSIIAISDILLLTLLFFNSCIQEDTFAKATIETSQVTLITEATAVCGGTISADGGSAVTARGICWNTSSTPTIDDFKTANGSGSGSFTSSITGLKPGTTYFVRSYASNSAGTSYGNELSFTTSDTITDIDGNVYTTVTIGTQVWMVENLKTTKYVDGTSIPLVNDGTAWTNLATSGYCWYNNDAANKTTFGALYNWYAVNTGKIAPIGWHVPTNTEWTTLTTYLTNNGFGYGGSGSEIAKSMASTSGWVTSSSAGDVGNDQSSNNSSGFAAFPGGLRTNDGSFLNMTGTGSWWSSTSSNYGAAWCLSMGAANSIVSIGQIRVQEGYSVRCIRDN